MTELTLRPDLAERLHDLAQREHRPVDDVIETLLAQYMPRTEPIASDSGDPQAKLLRQDRQRAYERARRYWRTVGDDRQQMTDDQLDDQFWLFDQEGVPHLKSEQGTVTGVPSPLHKMLEIMEAAPPLA